MTTQHTDGPIDFAILTAIEVERRAVCAVFGLTAKDRVKKDGRWYWLGKLPLPGGGDYRILVAQPMDMGNVEAALLASDVIRQWSPSAALLVGIAASADSDEVKLGDVVVGRSILYHEHGKVTAEGIAPQPEMIPADAGLLRHFAGMADWGGDVPVLMPGDPGGKPKVHHGVIASGEKVIADAAARNRISSAHRKTLALEMEGFGFSRAVWQSVKRVRHLDIRGICDDATSTKNDRWHRYAAFAAAAFTKHFLQDRPLDPAWPSPPNKPVHRPSKVSDGRAHAPKPTPKYYVYISKTKVDMFWRQIPERSGSPSWEEKALRVSEYIERHAVVGSIANPGPYIKDIMLADVSVFGQYTLVRSRSQNAPIIGLSCSTEHFVGVHRYVKQRSVPKPASEDSSHVGSTSPDFSVRLAGLLERKEESWRFWTALKKFFGGRKPVLPTPDCGPEHLILRSIANFSAEGMAQRVEFLAKVLLYGQYEETSVILASPIYVALQ